MTTKTQDTLWSDLTDALESAEDAEREGIPLNRQATEMVWARVTAAISAAR
jgi:hypothetical protein